MSGPFGSSQWMYSSGGFYDFPIEQSLKFNDDDSAYLVRTPSSSGNLKTYTQSLWLKRGNLSANTPSNDRFLSSSDNATGDYLLQFDGSDRLQLYDNTINLVTNAVYRDTSAWYHFVVSVDTTQATSSDRVKIYVNGEQVTSFSTATYPSQNADTFFNRSGFWHAIGAYFTSYPTGGQYFDGYLAEVNFIDGQALDASSFGEFKSGVWIPKDPSGLTYGTNGFRLSFQNDTVSEGFNTVTYTGTGTTNHSVNGIGFQPDLVWIKARSNTYYHWLNDTVRGAGKGLVTNTTDAEYTSLPIFLSFDNDGFTVDVDSATANNTTNGDGQTFVAWCWDAGSGSPVSNTDGSITSTVKANAAYGFSIVSYTGNGSSGATIGHGLSSAPEMVIVKARNFVDGWVVYHKDTATNEYLLLNTTDADFANSTFFNNTAPSSSVVTLGNNNKTNAAYNYIAYAFHSVAGYSKVGSYSGSGSAGNTITTGFKPAFVMLKCSSDSSTNWRMYDATRDTVDPRLGVLIANGSNAEADAVGGLDFTDTGFEINETGGDANGSGRTYIYIAFADTRDNAFWRDQSGNGNDWQPNNLTYQDSLPDSPTNNFATLNPLNGFPNLSEGNLKIYAYTDGTNNLVQSSIEIPSSGKWYAEYCHTGAYGTYVGVSTISMDNAYAGDRSSFYYNAAGGYITTTGQSNDTTPAEWYSSSTYVLGFAVDSDAGTIKYYLDGVLQTTVNLPDGHGYHFTYSNAGGGSNSGLNFIWNFGQDSSFAGNKTPQGNTDDNGVGDFYYAPPSGYLALCTANLPDPVIDPAQDDVPSDYFNTVLWTGDGTSPRTITNIGFDPDLTWGKQRSGTKSHQLYDNVRDSGVLFSNATSAETDVTTTSNGGLTDLTTDGFVITQGTTGTDSLNGSGQTYVAWNWKAGNGTSSNTLGSITSTVSVNQKAGFSVVGYNTGGSTSVTVGHGLGASPKMIIAKNRDETTNWFAWHTGIATTEYLVLNSTAAKASGITWNPTSTTFAWGHSASTDWIAYCFAEVEGYSKFGSYVGNSSTDGPFVYTGFRPAWVMIKSSSNASTPWQIFDATRETFNTVEQSLVANGSNAEPYDTASPVDFLSNGFKLRGGGSSWNNYNTGTWIYACFSEQPFKYANAR